MGLVAAQVPGDPSCWMECRSVPELSGGAYLGGRVSARPPHPAEEHPGEPQHRPDSAATGVALLKVKSTVNSDTTQWNTIPAIKNSYVGHVAPWKSADDSAPSAKGRAQHSAVAVLSYIKVTHLDKDWTGTWKNPTWGIN